MGIAALNPSYWLCSVPAAHRGMVISGGSDTDTQHLHGDARYGYGPHELWHSFAAAEGEGQVMHLPQTPVARCLQSQRMCASLWPLIACQAPPLPRFALVASTAALAHEHHSAITKLVEGGNFASAATLVRPLVETAITGAWALYCAPVEKIEGLFWNTHKMPKPNTMLSAISRRPELEGKLGLKELMDGQGAVLHRYTHGDMDQLRRRFNLHGYTFSERENTGTLYISDLMLLLAATIFSATTRAPRLEAFLKHHADSVVGELGRDGLDVTEWKGWQPLPDPAIPLGTIPKNNQGP